VRIWDISGLHLLPNRSAPDGNTYVFADFLSLSYQRRYFESPAWDMFSAETFNQKNDWSNFAAYQTRSIYTPVIFLPQAIVAGLIWRVFNFPIIPGIILIRLAGLLVYGLGAYLAIRLAPAGKWVFTFLALSPMALYQAATLNADGFTNAASFLFIALTLKVYADKDVSLRTRETWAREAWTLAGASLLLGLAKPGTVILLPLLLILLRRRSQTKLVPVILLAGVLLAIAVSIGWSAIAVPNSRFSEGGNMSLGRQLQLILASPVNFLSVYARGVFLSLGNYFHDWVGVYGFWVGIVPPAVYIFYPLTLLAALLAEPRFNDLTQGVRGYLIALFLACAAVVAMLYFFLHYSPDVVDALGRQGRYFIPFALLLFMGLAGLISISERLQSLARLLAIGLFLAAAGFYAFGAYAAYYTQCGYPAFVGQPCVLPVYKNIEKINPPVVVVNSAAPLSQSFTSQCEQFSAVKVLIKSVLVGSATPASLHYSLLGSGGQVLAALDVRLSDIQPDAELTLAVPPGSTRKGDRYLIRLEVPELLPPDGVRAAIRSGDVYTEGDLSAGGVAQNGDLIFNYVCTRP